MHRDAQEDARAHHGARTCSESRFLRSSSWQSMPASSFLKNFLRSSLASLGATGSPVLNNPPPERSTPNNRGHEQPRVARLRAPEFDARGARGLRRAFPPRSRGRVAALRRQRQRPPQPRGDRRSRAPRVPPASAERRVAARPVVFGPRSRRPRRRRYPEYDDAPALARAYAFADRDGSGFVARTEFFPFVRSLASAGRASAAFRFCRALETRTTSACQRCKNQSSRGSSRRAARPVDAP